MYRENYIGFVPSTQNHGNWTFPTEESGRNPAGEYPLYLDLLLHLYIEYWKKSLDSIDSLLYTPYLYI